MKNVAEIRNLSIDELQSELLKLRREQFGLRMKKANGSLEKSHLINKVRRAIAKIKTVMTEKAGEHDVK